MVLPSRLGCPLSLKTPNMGNRGILKKCVNSQAVYPRLNNTGSRPERGDTPPMRKESTGSRSESRRSAIGGLGAKPGPEADPGVAGGRLSGKGEVGAQIRLGLRYRLSEYGRARRLTLSSGTIQLRRPRVRDTEEQFESRLLPLFVNRTRKIAELYLHGLSEGDFDLALRGLLGEDAPVSASTVARLKSKWNDSLPNGAAGPWMTSKWCTWMVESTSRLVLMEKAAYWW